MFLSQIESAQIDLPDGRHHWRAARLLFSVLVVLAPAGVGQEVERIADECSVRGLAQAGGVGLENLLMLQIQRPADNPRRVGSVLYGHKRVPVYIKPVNPAE